MIDKKGIKMSDNSQNDMIKNQIKDFISHAVGDYVLEKTVTETDIDDILRAPGIVEQINEFNKDQNRNDDNFMQGLCVGLDFGFRFGLIYLSKCMLNSMDNIESTDTDSPIEVTPAFLN